MHVAVEVLYLVVYRFLNKAAPPAKKRRQQIAEICSSKTGSSRSGRDMPDGRMQRRVEDPHMPWSPA
jgi:hypothetical protein